MPTLDQIVAKQQRQAAALRLTAAEREELNKLRKAGSSEDLEELQEEVAELRGKVESLQQELGDEHGENERLLKKVERAKSSSRLSKRDVTAAIAEASARLEGKTLGLQLPDSWRARLDVQGRRLGVKTNKHMVLTCILLGLAELELIEVKNDSKGTLEGVPDLQRPGDQGNGRDSAAGRRAS